jgi:methyl-accepting chemotaxis protein
VGAAAEQVLGSAGELAKQSDCLKKEVESFLATVRAA